MEEGIYINDEDDIIAHETHYGQVQAEEYKEDFATMLPPAQEHPMIADDESHRDLPPVEQHVR